VIGIGPHVHCMRACEIEQAQMVLAYAWAAKQTISNVAFPTARVTEGAQELRPRA
jgi:hypothetical protein